MSGGVNTLTFAHAASALPTVNLQANDQDAGDVPTLQFLVNAFQDNSAYQTYAATKGFALPSLTRAG